MSNTCCLQSQEQYRHVFYRKRPVLLYLITWAHLHHNINWYWETWEDLNMHLTPISYLEDVEKKQVIRKKARHGKRSINEWLSTDLFPPENFITVFSKTSNFLTEFKESMLDYISHVVTLKNTLKPSPLLSSPNTLTAWIFWKIISPTCKHL